MREKANVNVISGAPERSARSQPFTLSPAARPVIASKPGTGVINPMHLEKLCCELRVLLEAEIASGNRISESSQGWPLPESILVLLAAPFHNTPEQLPPSVRLVDVNDPHWWKQEYEHVATGCVLACRR